MAAKSSPLTRVVAVLFGLACLVWCVWQPVDPSRLHQAMPLGSSCVVDVDDVGDWITYASSHPLGKDSELAGLVENDRLMGVLRDQRALFSLGPGRGAAGRRPVNIAMALGGKGALVRLLLEAGLVKAVGFDSRHDGVQIWRVRNEIAGGTLSFSIVEGLLLCSLHDAGDGVPAMLRALGYDRDLPGVMASNAQLAEARGTETREIRAWMDWVRMTGGSDGTAYISGRVTGHEGQLDARIRLRRPGGSLARVRKESFEVPGRLIAGRSATVLAGDAALMAPLFGRNGAPAWFTAVTSVDSGSRQPVLVSMLHKDVPSSISGLGVPAFVLGVECADRNQAATHIDTALDKIFSLYELRLRPEAIRIGEADAVILRMPAGGSYSAFRPDENLVCFIVDNWLFCVNGLRAATELLEGASRADEDSGLLKGIESADGAPVWFGHMDPDATSAALRKALAGYYAAVMAGEAEDNFGIRAKYRMWQRQLEMLPLWGVPSAVIYDERHSSLELRAQLEF